MGFRVGRFAYSVDLKEIPPESEELVSNLDIWVLDALRRRFHVSHLSLDESLALVARFTPGKTILTDMHVDLDYETLTRELPQGVVPGYDGMKIEINEG